MSKYKYSLKDYHAVGNAEINIDGITVLAGENGSGNSTLSRWLYYIVNIGVDYDKYLFGSFKMNVLDMLRRVSLSQREMRMSNHDVIPIQYTEIAKTFSDFNSDESGELKEIYSKMIEEFSRQLSTFVTSGISASRKNRLLSYLGVPINDLLSFDTGQYLVSQMGQFDVLERKYIQDKEQRRLSSMYSLIKKEYFEEDKEPANIQLSEDGVDVMVDNHLGNIFNLRRAIYVDTPMSLSLAESAYSGHIYWDKLHEKMMAKECEMPESGKSILLRIKKIIDGQITVEKDIIGDENLHFVREDGLDIPLESSATGLKTFAYIQRLLENGYLDDGTLLLIDEPEAHLHPQWIVEFAHLLVLLNKHLGVKIMLASHNPDMVSALHSLSAKENMEETTHFYLAEKQSGTFKYIYKDLGNNIEEIFQSFNIALERIQQYGGASDF